MITDLGYDEKWIHVSWSGSSSYDARYKAGKTESDPCDLYLYDEVPSNATSTSTSYNMNNGFRIPEKSSDWTGVRFSTGTKPDMGDKYTVIRIKDHLRLYLQLYGGNIRA